MGRLYDLTADYAALQDMMEDVTEDNEQVIKDTFEAVSGEYNIKIENCCKVIKNLAGEKLAIKNERKRLELKEKTIDNRIEQLKDMIEESLRSLDLKTAGGDILKARIQKNGGKLPLIMDVDASELPDDYRTVTYKADSDKLRKVLESGETLVYCHLGERGEHLKIGG